MNRSDYDVVVRDAIDALPEKFRSQMEGVVVVIEDRPQRGRRARLLGLYEGVPLTAWGRGDMHAKLPDQITLFSQTIERVAQSEEEIPHIVRETLWHEIAHHFGFDHDAMHEMEKRWKNRRKKN